MRLDAHQPIRQRKRVIIGDRDDISVCMVECQIERLHYARDGDFANFQRQSISPTGSYCSRKLIVYTQDHNDLIRTALLLD